MSLLYSAYFVLTFFIYLMCDDLCFSDFGFLSFAVPSNWKSSGSPIFFHFAFFGNMFCLTNWIKMFWYYYVCFFHQIALSVQYLRFCFYLVFALLYRVGEAVFCMSLSLVALIGLILSVRDVHCLFYLANWV